MQVWIVTGGIGCGKSTVMSLLKAALDGSGCVVFSADAVVHDGLTERASAGRIVEVFGRSVLAEDGQIERSKLRALALGDAGLRKQLEQILHPLVRERFADVMAGARSELGERGTMLAEVPLFHESDDLYPCDLAIMVAASRTTQIQRICASRAIVPAEAEAFIQAQLPISLKMERSGSVIWNDGSLPALEDQVALLAGMREAA